MIIYKVTNKINSKCYIGKTCRTLDKRRSEHIKPSYKDKASYFHNALKKYGTINFDWDILEECSSIEDLDLAEKWYIRYFDTYDNGYNLTFGGGSSAGFKHSQKVKNFLSNINSGENNYWYGKKLTQKHCEKIRQSKLGKEIHISKMGKENKRKATIESNKTRKITDEHRAKMSKNNPMNRIEVRNKVAKDWTFLFDNEKITIRNLSNFCKENNINYHTAKSRIYKYGVL